MPSKPRLLELVCGCLDGIVLNSHWRCAQAASAGFEHAIVEVGGVVAIDQNAAHQQLLDLALADYLGGIANP